MILTLLCLFLVFVFLCVVEILWRVEVIKGETSRKFVHIIIGTFVAFWPFLMGLRTIQFISLAFLAVILVSRHFRIFQAIHSSRKETVGEILFAISIGLLPFITASRLVFAAAVLHLSLADGMAGLIGSHFGKSTRFKVFGQTKSIVGSLTFAVMSYCIVFGFFKASRFANLSDINLMVIALPLLATLIETVSIKSSDNLLVPILVAAVLNSIL